ncbi:MAG: universal stress protein [Chloroflexi bacterium]|nr:universal stress protein [Chloroflexota bacterium]MCH7655160.1 universal stress protein [Chloroflexota bacterium]
MYERILVPLDGSELARQALPYAGAIAAARSVYVELVEVVAPLEALIKPPTEDEFAAVGAGVGAYPWPASDEWAGVAERFREEAVKRLAEAESLIGGGTATRSVVLDGDPATAIIKEADKQPGTLIVMATHGRSGIGRWLLGSVTDKVVRHAHHPTLVVRARDDVDGTVGTIGEVILPLDGSSISEAAVPHAVEMSKILGVGISLVRTVSPASHADAFAEYMPDGYAQMVEEAREDAEEYLEGMATRIRDQGVSPVRTEASIGNASSMIVDRARAAQKPLVVMATHGRSGLGRWVLGSVADRVVRHGPGPVLVVRPDEAS